MDALNEDQCGCYVEPAAGRQVDLDGHVLRLLTSRQQTEGRLSVFEARNVVGVTDRHIHHDAVKAVYVLEGSYRWVIGDEEFLARAGSFLVVPRHTAHDFEAVTEGARQLFVFSPAGMDEFMIEASDRIARGLHAFEDYADLYERYDVEPVDSGATPAR